MKDLMQKPLSDWTWSDIELIVTNQLEESQTFELKKELPSKQGPDSWQQSGKKIGEHARDTLAEEIVAFANSYGGILIVGIDESDETPKRAAGFGDLINDCQNCIERLERAIRDRIDPPLSNLETRAIEKPGGDVKGVLIFRVGRSSMAPHGCGRPPAAYVRRGASKEPLTMRDMQSLFWETRTKRERVLQIQAERQRAFRELIEMKNRGKLSYYGTPIDADHPHLAFRCSVIPEESLHLSGIASTLRQQPMITPSLHLKKGHLDIPEIFGRANQGWHPKAHGSFCNDRNGSKWTISDEGLIEVAGFSLAAPDKSSPNSHFPNWFALAAAQVLIMGEKLRSEKLRSDVPLVIDCQFLHDGTALAQREYGRMIGNPDHNVGIGPFTVFRRSELESVFKELETEIWHGLGLAQLNNKLDIDFERTLESYILMPN